jgi:hypothetical protein
MSIHFVTYLEPRDGAFVEELPGQPPHLPIAERLYRVSAVATGRHIRRDGVALLFGAQLDSLAKSWVEYRKTNP